MKKATAAQTKKRPNNPNYERLKGTTKNILPEYHRMDADGTIRDTKTGRLIKGAPQETDKNGITGRPTTYKPEYCEKIIEHFDRPYFTLIETAHITGKNDFEKTEKKPFPSDLPTLQSFARSVGTTTPQLYQWAQANPEFAEAISRAKELQHDILVTNGLNGLYNPKFAVFMATNLTGLKERQQLDVTSGGQSLAPKVYLPSDLPDSYFDKQDKQAIEGEIV